MSMEQNGNQNMSAPTFCRNGCGFYAAQAFDGMCSKCYKDLKELQESSQPAVAPSPPSPATSRMPLVGAESNKKSDVDMVASSLSRASLGELNLNRSSSSGSSDKMSEKLGGGSGSSNASGGATGGVGSPSSSEVETGSPTVATVKASLEESGEGTSNEGDSGLSDTDQGKKNKKNRCMECRKKVGLTGFQCHCGKLFCSLHRYSDTHNCTFDFREQAQQEIRKNNPVIKGEKVQKI